jgi:hypothetical protein
MTTEPALPETGHHHSHKNRQGGGGGGAVYGIGLIGAWVYYFKDVTTFRQGVTAFFKGLVWPAYLVYEAFVFLSKK